jgi:3-deoxy-7-phosphoheptulonate synthase
MIVVLAPEATEGQIEAVAARLSGLGLAVHRSSGRDRTVLGVVGDASAVDPDALGRLPGVRDVVRVDVPFRLASRQFEPSTTVVRVGAAAIGGERVVLIAGPCAVEGEAQITAAALGVAAAGATVLRGGAFKPRTSPYTFQGLGEEGLRLLRRAADRAGLAVVTEALDVAHLPLVERYADMVQVGSRNMQNFPLLRAVGRCSRPVLLKRGMSATVEEWLLAAEHVLAEGNRQVALCERGIRTFEPYTRNTLDLSCVPVVQALSHLPVVVDPSHAVGLRDKVPAMARAAVAAGADGVMVEVHPEPELAYSDGAQSLDFAEFASLVRACRAVAAAVGREL